MNMKVLVVLCICFSIASGAWVKLAGHLNDQCSGTPASVSYFNQECTPFTNNISRHYECGSDGSVVEYTCEGDCGCANPRVIEYNGCIGTAQYSCLDSLDIPSDGSTISYTFDSNCNNNPFMIVYTPSIKCTNSACVTKNDLYGFNKKVASRVGCGAPSGASSPASFSSPSVFLFVLLAIYLIVA